MNRKNEIEAVKQLGEMIGYGNMMTLASALWAIQLNKSGSSTGAFVPALTSDLLARYRIDAMEQQANKIQEITRNS
ncbi:MAG: hypothetical protein ABIN91_11200 [Mucilaginibacter sp.]|uniref:hypothetical protein n=1 Tax=Mucilaginibacter sp. TaxID=1882438 RepID=UPI003263BD59